MSHEIEPGQEPEGGPEANTDLPAADAPTTDDPFLGDPDVEDEPGVDVRELAAQPVSDDDADEDALAGDVIA